MSELILRVVPQYDDYDGSIMSFKHEEVTVEQLLKERATSLNYMGFLVLDKNKGIDKSSEATLRKYGWIHLETAKNREEKKTLNQEYFLVDETIRASHLYYSQPKFSKIENIDKLTESQLDQIADGAKVVQVVSSKSVLSESDYKKVQTRIKQKEEQREKTKLARQKKAEKAKAKQIAEAKKLLEENNIVV